MEQIEAAVAALERFNEILERSFVFKGFKFVLAFYLVIMAISLVLMVYRLIKLNLLNVFLYGQETVPTKGKMQERWEKVKVQLASEDHKDWQMAVDELGKMLDEILGLASYSGNNLEEKLDNILPSQLGWLDELKNANEVKKRIVKSKKLKFSQEEVVEVAEVFVKTLRYFEAIQ